MADEGLCRLPLCEVVDRIQKRDISPIDVVEATLQRMERLEPTLNSFITVAAEEARGAARVLEAKLIRGDAVGLLAGVPIALKDVIATAGIPTTAGSPILADWTPDHDATVVARLRAA